VEEVRCGWRRVVEVDAEQVEVLELWVGGDPSALGENFLRRRKPAEACPEALRDEAPVQEDGVTGGPCELKKAAPRTRGFPVEALGWVTSRLGPV